MTASGSAAGVAALMFVLLPAAPALSQTAYGERVALRQSTSMTESFAHVEKSVQRKFMPRICKFLPNLSGCEKRQPR